MNKSKFTLPLPFGKEVLAKKWVRLLLDVLGSLIGLVFFVLLVLLARLTMGPINLDFLTPEVEAAFQAPQVGISASIEHTQLVWREWKRPFEIELVNVHLQKGQNPHWLTIEHIGVSLRLYRLLGGDVSLKQLRLYHPHILLEKDEKGEFTLGFGESTPNQEFSFKEIAPLLALGESTPALGKLNELNKISIIEAHVLLKDEKENQSWELPKATFVLRRQTQGFHAELILKPHHGHGYFMVSLAHQLGSARVDVSAHFQHISFKRLIEKDKITLGAPNPENLTPDDILNFLQHWNIPLHGKIHVAFVPETLQVIEGKAQIDLEEGELDLSLAKLLPLPITSGTLAFTLSPHEFELQKASLLSNKMLLNLSGKLKSPASPLRFAKRMSAGQTLDLQGELKDLFLDHLDALWPQDLSPLAREWLTQNLRKGTLTQAFFSLKCHGDETGFSLDDLEGTLQGEGVEVTYLKGLPPVQNVTAQGTFDQKGFDIKISSGNLEHIQMHDGHVIISGLENGNEALSLNVKAKGPLSHILEVINHKPLEYASYGGIDPQKTKGEGSVDLHFDFPLLADLQFKDVKIAVKGSLEKVELERKIMEEFKAQLIQGKLSVDLTQDQLLIKGQGILNQLPSTLTYIHSFKDIDPNKLQVKIETIASFEDFKRLGFDCQAYGKGPTKTTLLYTLGQDKKGRFLVNLDTFSSTLSFAPFGWEKKPGTKGDLSFVLLFEEGTLSKIVDLQMISAPYSLKGEVLFGSTKTWKKIHLSEFKGPHTDTQVTLYHPHEKAYEVSFKGLRVDLEKYFDYLKKEENMKDHPPTDVKLFADVDQLRFGEGKIFQNVKAAAELFLQGHETTWKSVSLRAKAGTGTAYKGDMAHVSGGISFDIKPGLNNTKTLEVRANDAGQFLKNLSIYDDIRGGYITVKAEKKAQGPYVGEFKLKKFDAHEVPLLARFAALLSPMGIANLFSANKTLSMDRFECHFEFTDDLITVKNGVGKSMSLGFTVEGKVDRKNRKYALKGNIIPARFLNSILNNIPLIGSFLSGGDGEGLFAIAYTVKGTFDAPHVTLNPLSIFAPGFLRKLFQSIGDEE